MNNRLLIIIKLSRQAFGKYKGQIVILTFLGFISGLLEGIGVNALIPLLSFIIGDDQGGNDIISQTIENFFIYFNVSFNLESLLIFISLLFIFKAIVLLFFHYIKIKITSDYEEETKNDLFKNTLKANWSHLLKQKLGYLETILMVDVKFATLLLERISGIIMIFTGLLIYTLIAINISFYITLITLALGGTLFLIFKPLVYKTRIVAHKVANMNKDVTHHINENILGMKAIKAMSVGKKVMETSKKYFYEFKKLQVTLYLLSAITNSLLQPISLIFICVILFFSYQSSNFNFAALIAVIYLIQRIFQYIQQIQSSLHKINEATPYLRNVLEYQEKNIQNKEKNQGVNRFKFNNKLEFKEVAFSYHSNQKILSKVNFSIKRGEMVGLIGPSGAGKTTLVDLFLRLFDPTSGIITLDDKNISEINLDDWRKNIGYVSQDIFLMNDTIANNIKFFNNSITNEDVKRVAKIANIYDFIQNCPAKFSTIIGERGIQLSVGQRQRIIIARVLARNPQILILDEATSALDNESEVKIQRVIENLKGKVTVLVIAHRLSTVINSDKLMVLEKGKISEQGDVKKLLKDKQSYFYKVYNIRK